LGKRGQRRDYSKAKRDSSKKSIVPQHSPHRSANDNCTASGKKKKASIIHSNLEGKKAARGELIKETKEISKK